MDRYILHEEMYLKTCWIALQLQGETSAPRWLGRDMIRDGYAEARWGLAAGRSVDTEELVRLIESR